MPYLGKSPSFGVRQRYQYTATAGQTTFSGTDTENLTLNYTDNNFVDVFQNGVLLKGGGTDYTATSGTSVVLATGASVSDVIEIIVYDAFSAANFYSRTDSDSRYVNVSGDTMTGALDLDGQELVLDADGDTSITADTDDAIDIRTGGSDRIRIDGDGTFIKGVTSAQTNAGITPRFQIEGSSSNETALSIVRHSADDNAPSIRIGKTRGTGSELVSDNDFVGLIRFFAGDGTDRESTVADIFCQIDGSTGANDTPGNLQFHTTADGSNSSTERMRIEEDGHILIGQADDQGGHRFLVNESVNDNAMIIRSTNASFSETSLTINANRGNTSAYDFLVMGSNNGSDNEFLFDGGGDGFADGSFSGGGADYAEYFEWKDGNSSSEDRVGISVKLDGDKIVASSDSDNASDIIGVISANPAVTGDSANLKWNNKYLTDDYGRYIREEYTATEWTEVKINSNGSKQEKYHSYETDKIPSDVTVPSDAKVISEDDEGAKLTRRKLNPDYDASKTYVPRPKRKEWDAVGMMGKLRMQKGQKTGANWIKMRDISDTVEEWLVR